MITASAPGKIILCGEHAVVYRQPAIALPLPDLRATATVETVPSVVGIVCDLPDLGERWLLHESWDHPLAKLLRLTAEHVGVHTLDHLLITLRSAIPIAGGMGSGAALGAALVKAIAAYLGTQLTADEVSRLVYESERFYHGTPSGIDNTVVSYEQAIWFVRGLNGAPPQLEPISIGKPLHLLIGDTGVRAPTHVTVGGVRERRLRDPERYNALFGKIGRLARAIRQHLANGDQVALGAALDHNQALLHEIGVSSPELEQLIGAARQAGALGAKLSGGGGGGIMLALVRETQRAVVAEAIMAAGATQVIPTIVM